MPNAVSELALLNSSWAIPAEFWPDNITRRQDEDQHRPWWEVVPGPGPDLAGEELWEQRLELYEELILREEENRPFESSTAFKNGDGVYYFHVTFPCPESITVMSQMKSAPYTTPDKPKISAKNITLPPGSE